MLGPNGKPLLTSTALGGHFAYLAVNPKPDFYNALREQGNAEPVAILWLWTCMVHSFVDLVVQLKNHGTEKVDDVYNRVLIALIENTKVVGASSEADLVSLEESSTEFRLILRAFLRSPAQVDSIRIGQILSETLGCRITNPHSLFMIGHEFMELHTAVHRTFSDVDLV